MSHITYHNLSQCKGKHMCYIRSTDIEQKNWVRLLWSVSDEMLYHLMLGNTVTIVDRSTKPKGKVERIFVPVFNDILRTMIGEIPRHNSLAAHYDWAMHVLQTSPSLAGKYVFFAKRMRHAPQLKAHTIQVKKETNPLEKRYK